jgi:hypothetical protein
LPDGGEHHRHRRGAAFEKYPPAQRPAEGADEYLPPEGVIDMAKDWGRIFPGG